MKIEPYASNAVLITSDNGICISISDDGNSISIQRKKDYQTTLRIKGVHFNLEEHHSTIPDSIIDSDVVRIDP